jgi:uncharacterized protein (TIGR00369 family)
MNITRKSLVDIPKPELPPDGEPLLCFGCSQDNPIGLKVKMDWDGQQIRAVYTPHKLHQGWPGLVHGGILMTVLDEVMANTAFAQGIRCVTATLQVKLKHPARLEDDLVATAWVTRKTSRLLDTAGRLERQDGTLIAESTATFFVVSSRGNSDDSWPPESDKRGIKN